VWLGHKVKQIARKNFLSHSNSRDKGILKFATFSRNSIEFLDFVPSETLAILVLLEKFYFTFSSTSCSSTPLYEFSVILSSVLSFLSSLLERKNPTDQFSVKMFEGGTEGLIQRNREIAFFLCFDGDESRVTKFTVASLW